MPHPIILALDTGHWTVMQQMQTQYIIILQLQVDNSASFNKNGGNPAASVTVVLYRSAGSVTVSHNRLQIRACFTEFRKYFLLYYRWFMFYCLITG